MPVPQATNVKIANKTNVLVMTADAAAVLVLRMLHAVTTANATVTFAVIMYVGNGHAVTMVAVPMINVVNGMPQVK